MFTVAFTLMFISLAASIYSTSGCEATPTSDQDLLTYYSKTKDCAAGNRETNFEPDHTLLVDCNADTAMVYLDSTISRDGGGRSSTDIDIQCTLSNGTCNVKSDYLSSSESSKNITLPKSWTVCLFAACFRYTFPYKFYTIIFYVNLTKCTLETDSTEQSKVTAISPTPSSPSTAAMSPTSSPPYVITTSSTPRPHTVTAMSPPSPPAAIKTKMIAVSSAIVLIIIAAILILFIVIFTMRSTSTNKHNLIFIQGDGDIVDITIGPMNTCSTVWESQESIHLSLFQNNRSERTHIEREAPQTAADVENVNILAQEEVTKLTQSSDGNSSNCKKDEVVEDTHSHSDSAMPNQNLDIINDQSECFSVNLDQSEEQTTSMKCEGKEDTAAYMCNNNIYDTPLSVEDAFGNIEHRDCTVPVQDDDDIFLDTLLQD